MRRLVDVLMSSAPHRIAASVLLTALLNEMAFGLAPLSALMGIAAGLCSMGWEAWSDRYCEAYA